MLKGAFESLKYEDVIESSFTRPRTLTPGQRWRFDLVYKFHRVRKDLITAMSFAYLALRYPAIIPIQYRARKDGGFAGSFQWLRLAEIVKFVKRYNPKSIIEFGSGASSAILAMVASEKILSVEESEYWLSRLLENMGELAQKINFVRAERVIATIDGEAVCYYDIDHSRYYDFVYVDGPVSEPPKDAKGLTIKDPVGYMPNVDVELFWKNKVYPKFILIDTRRATVRRLIQKAQDRYHVYMKSDFLFMSHIPELSDFRFHTVMIRKD